MKQNQVEDTLNIIYTMLLFENISHDCENISHDYKFKEVDQVLLNHNMYVSGQ